MVFLLNLFSFVLNVLLGPLIILLLLHIATVVATKEINEFEFVRNNSSLCKGGQSLWLTVDKLFLQKKNVRAGFEPTTSELIKSNVCIDPQDHDILVYPLFKW